MYILDSNVFFFTNNQYDQVKIHSPETLVTSHPVDYNKKLLDLITFIQIKIDGMKRKTSITDDFYLVLGG